MPSVYTIEGASPKRKKRRSSPAQKKAQARMKRAAKACKGLRGTKFKSCMSRALKK
jgi:hypothetical protein